MISIPNISAQRNSIQKNRDFSRTKKQPSFGSVATKTKEFVYKSTYRERKLAEKLVKENLSDKGKRLVNFSTGEAQNILINAVGTGLVAPFFIAYNPLSKTDEQTKKYSALRQPVSAVLSVVTQVGLLIPFNKAIDKLYNKGLVGKTFDMSFRQDDGYIENVIKRRRPEWSKEKIDAEVKRIGTKKFNKAADYARENFALPKLSQEEFIQTMHSTCKEKLKEIKKTIKAVKKESKKLAKEIRIDPSTKEQKRLFAQIANSIEEKKPLDHIKKQMQELMPHNVDMIRETVSTHISDTKLKIKSNKLIYGSLFTLSILPFTCHALNWLYPRFMEIAFPHLVGSKEGKK